MKLHGSSIFLHVSNTSSYHIVFIYYVIAIFSVTKVTITHLKIADLTI